MIFFKKHRQWIILNLTAFVLAGASLKTFDYAHEYFSVTKTRQTAEVQSLTARVTQMNNDAKTAEELQAQIRADEVDKILLPTDRIAMTDNLVQSALRYRIKDMTYTLAPPRPLLRADANEEKSKSQNALFSDDTLRSVTESDLVIDGFAPTDREIFQMLDALNVTPQGRLDFLKITIEPLDQSHVIDSYNLKFHAELKWVANAALHVKANEHHQETNLAD